MSYIINIESSTEICSVSLSEKGKIVDFKENKEGRNHARLMAVYIQNLMTKNNIDYKLLDGVAVSKGPGSYTGLRIGVSIAKGLCYAQDIPLIAISPLQAMSDYVRLNKSKFNLPDNNKLIYAPMIDARRMEVYTASYDINNKEIKPVCAKVLDKDSFKEELEKYPVAFFGNGSEKAKKVITNPNAFFIPDIICSSRFMNNLSYQSFIAKQFVDVAYFEPFYLKNFIAGISKKNILRPQV
ncbi:MAG: tRNA (adenosine(37)-N6)-threonylcarbamoyltransferase complex dimerization subunit type 1 TsaB [Prolixibacteraceae bacterium]|nr:tRNA (adenosine(37)-N6)-threonylcarbamoyltransferase complex dimerization subunit type 1 TsaB [Prolixibacteraceae bacterium]